MSTDQNPNGKVHIQPGFGHVGDVWLWSMVPTLLLERIDDFGLEETKKNYGCGAKTFPITAKIASSARDKW